MQIAIALDATSAAASTGKEREVSEEQELIEALRDPTVLSIDDEAAARTVERIIRERDEARAKALDEAAAAVTEHYQFLCQEHRLLLVNRANAILALKDKPGK